MKLNAIKKEAQRCSQNGCFPPVKVGAVVFSKKDGIILTGANRAICDYRKAGIDPGDVTVHAEEDVLAQASQRGISLKGCSIFITRFPCLKCSRLLAMAGIKDVYFIHDDRPKTSTRSKMLLAHYGITYHGVSE